MDSKNQTNRQSAATTSAAETQQPQPTRWLNGIPAVAVYTGCSRRSIQNWISNGELRVRRLSARHIMASAEDVDDLIQRMDQEYRARAGFEAAQG